MKKEVLNVVGMSCVHCEARVNVAVSEIEGVKSCKANAVKDKVTVKYDENKTNLKAIIDAIIAAEYEVIEG